MDDGSVKQSCCVCSCWDVCSYADVNNPKFQCRDCRLKRARAQIAEAISILETGTNYEKAHVVQILKAGL